MKTNMTFTLCLLIFLINPLFAQNISFHGLAKNSVYQFEQEETHTRVYQYLRFNVISANRNIVLNSSVRVLTESNSDLTNNDRFKAYSFNLRFKQLLKNKLDLTFGRQFLHPGTVMGALDGINAVYALNKMKIQLYTGTESHYTRGIELNSLDDRFVIGGLFQYNIIKSTNAQLLYLRKSNKDATLWEITGLNFTSKYFDKTLLRMQAHYDAQNARMHRLLLAGRRYWSAKLSTILEFKVQSPQIYANSYFTIFEAEPYQRYKLGGTYQLNDRCSLSARFHRIQFDDAGANQVYLSLQNHNGSLGLIYESGDAGDQLGFTFDYGHEILNNLVLSIYTDYSKYRTEEIYEYDNQLANAVRASYRLLKNLTIDLEYQWLTNRFQKSDSRLLNHISYRW